eukprot:GILJ01032814.1.p1 GENE.GILJ01032814.1~~GILJ01032814.1.p1  ORF type:complete len:136 (+),score=25.19 GILJ01032814.1:30-410(+)
MDGKDKGTWKYAKIFCGGIAFYPVRATNTHYETGASVDSYLLLKSEDHRIASVTDKQFEVKEVDQTVQVDCLSIDLREPNGREELNICLPKRGEAWRKKMDAWESYVNDYFDEAEHHKQVTKRHKK